jgi:tRNA threonylcarbamoyladenosine biosynthesis protein TsaB
MGERAAVLAIESSQREASVALRPRAGAPIDERPVPAPDDAHDHLMAAIASLCAAHGVEPRDLAVIAVSTGPGGFTGLRVGCATAKAIADATRAALVAVPSAAVAARTAVMRGELVDGGAMVVLSSKGDTAWVEPMPIRGGWPAPGRGGVCTAAEFRPAGAPVLADAALPAAFHAACAVAGSRVLAAAWSAAACLELAAPERGVGIPTDPLRLAPTYARPPEAVTLWEQRHGA